MMVTESIRKLIQYFIGSIVAVVITCGTIYGGYTLYMDITHNAVYEDRVIASGIINDKYDTSYSCGSKGRYTCYARYFVVNGKAVVVSDDLYLKKRKGEYITLTMNKLVDRGYVANGWGVISMIIFACVSVVSAVMFLMWVFDDEAAKRRERKKGFLESFND